METDFAYRPSSKEKEMRVICAWCGKVIKKGDGDVVSHGICAACAEQVTGDK